ncbi:MAG: hypothetical protein F4Y79_06110 [Gemmatimonadetes bacterium]|nr:hypothetical protein [Gemmatimonadota bacterium]MYF16612.1 hypothetical protein [Gemmatimonadota bacterium]
MDKRLEFKYKLHERYAVQAYDNADVWAGKLTVELDGIRYDAVMARAFLMPDSAVEARVRTELFVADIDFATCRTGDVEARLWTDVNDRGFVDERGEFRTGTGFYVSMHIVVDRSGQPVLSGNNLIFESDVIQINQTGVFHYTVEFSADDKAVSDASKAWISVNDIALNRDGVIAISPEQVRRCLSITEVCVRKVGARLDADGQFVSGTFCDVTSRLGEMQTDVVYLLPFFEPGFGDLHTGQDVRKGALGSVYAVRDFYRIDPALVTPPEEVDFLPLVSDGLIVDLDLQTLLHGRQLSRLRKVDDFNNFRTFKELVDWVGRDTLIQLIGRAELRALTRRAHALGKQVIFDLVLMQTSRDCPLIEQYPDWYVMDEHGQPKIHQIAWLVYSDVALLDLPFNRPLQNYLSGIAPFWMRTCDLDGVRIDASQTVDRPFLKQIKNRINAVKPDALVLGETLCELGEAVDIPVDMIYALLVDFHRDAEYGNQYADFLERTSGTFVPRTVAMAYFENHDSPRATKIWRERYHSQTLALLRNIQCSLINATAGTAHYVNLAYALEWGSEWGEETRTDFEASTLLHPEWAEREPHSQLVAAYEALHKFVSQRPELQTGHVYFYRNTDSEDRVFAYTRYTRHSGFLVAHNLDARFVREVVCPIHLLPDVFIERIDRVPAYDTYEFFDGLDSDHIALTDEGVSMKLQPLQSVVIKLIFRSEE